MKSLINLVLSTIAFYLAFYVVEPLKEIEPDFASMQGILVLIGIGYLVIVLIEMKPKKHFLNVRGK